MNVLVVDDNPINIKIAEAIFSRLNCKIFTALSGFAALEICKMHSIDLFVVDFNMPEMGGVDLIKRLRQIESENLLDTAVILGGSIGLTEKTRHALLQAGADFVINKPFVLTQVAAYIK